MLSKEEHQPPSSVYLSVELRLFVIRDTHRRGSVAIPPALTRARLSWVQQHDIRAETLPWVNADLDGIQWDILSCCGHGHFSHSFDSHAVAWRGCALDITGGKVSRRYLHDASGVHLHDRGSFRFATMGS